MLLVNCDLGERGVAHPIDDQLVSYISVANIACGGHAGDSESVNYYLKLCEDNNVKVTAHISYPDKQDFGRKVVQIDDDVLTKSFDEQLALFDGKIKAVKPHGALYNELNVSEHLAKVFVEWCYANGIQELLVSPFGIVKKYADAKGIKTIKESFAERGYLLDKNSNPMLIPRGQPNAEIHEVNRAVEQYLQLSKGFIEVDSEKVAFDSQTICIHSDSTIALDLAKELYKVGNSI